MTDAFFPSDQKFQRSSTAMGSDVADGVIVMDIESGGYYSFNDTGSEIWRALETPVTREDIVARLCAHYEIEPDLCRAKVAAFLDQMVQSRIVHPV